ncbi:MAG: MBL fold metallo-hydrolase [Pseudomonadota bacterium]
MTEANAGWQEPTELIIEQIEIGPMQNYTYIIGSRETREVAIVDPAWDIDSLVKHLAEKDYKLTAALATHYHPDHVGGSFSGHNVEGVATLLETQAVKVYAHKAEADGIKKVTEISETDLVRVDSGDTLKLGNIEVEFLHTPGHTPGSQCFRIKNTLVSGDTLFINGCGRVDLPGSDSQQMYESLRKLAGLPDDTLLLPGHNYGHVPNATMGETKNMNPYLRIDDPETWASIMGH